MSDELIFNFRFIQFQVNLIKKMGKHSQKKAKQPDPKLQALAKRKKEMKVFKLPTDMSKRINKKAKKVTSHLKKVSFLCS